MSYPEDQKWTRRFVPALKTIVGHHMVEQLVGEAPYEEDALRNTDLVVLRMNVVRIACRVRRSHYASNREWREQFTIRDSRPSGVMCELEKIIEGWGDYFVYGFANEDERTLAGWLIGDLRVFRRWFMTELVRLKGGKPGIQIPNKDDSSTFRAFWVHSQPKAFVVARQELPPLLGPQGGGNAQPYDPRELPNE